jgi:hypothetical protein
VEEKRSGRSRALGIGCRVLGFSGCLLRMKVMVEEEEEEQQQQ